jgi:hypothetical protein
MATVVVAVVAIVIGLSLDGTILSVAALNDAVASALATVGIEATRTLARLLIVAAPTLLILGSLLRGL